jgi:hypothetical protein
MPAKNAAMLEVFQICDAYRPWKNPAQYAASVLMR